MHAGGMLLQLTCWPSWTLTPSHLWEQRNLLSILCNHNNKNLKLPSRILTPLGTLQIHNPCVAYCTNQDTGLKDYPRLPVSGGVGLKPRVSVCLILELVFFSLDAITTPLFIILSLVHSFSSFLSCHAACQALFQALSEPDEQEQQERKQ